MTNKIRVHPKPRVLSMTASAVYQRAWRAQRQPEQVEAQRERDRHRANALRRLVPPFLIAYKIERGCTDCGYADDARALQFDHIDGGGSKRRSPAQCTTIAAAEREIQNCEVVCANCHAIRTSERGQNRMNKIGRPRV